MWLRKTAGSKIARGLLIDGMRKELYGSVPLRQKIFLGFSISINLDGLYHGGRVSLVSAEELKYSKYASCCFMRVIISGHSSIRNSFANRSHVGSLSNLLHSL